MTYYRDLEPCTYFRRRRPFKTLLAVGWLSSGFGYPRGSVDQATRTRLKHLLRDPWDPFGPGYRGQHACEFCRTKSSQVNLFVPGIEAVYVAPELVLHYIDAHEYAPPDEFCTAVLACPELDSPDYLAALTREGGKEFAWYFGLIEPLCPTCGGKLVTSRRRCRACRTYWDDPESPRRIDAG